MDFKRVLRHLFTGPLAVRGAFPATALTAIEHAIAQSEFGNHGEIRFAVEPALDMLPLVRATSARERAIEVFSQLRVWDTEYNNGVLIYLLLADHDVEIVADRGIDARVGSKKWEVICRQMETSFRQGQQRQGGPPCRRNPCRNSGSSLRNRRSGESTGVPEATAARSPTPVRSKSRCYLP